MTPTNELEVVRALGRIEGNLDGVNKRFDAVDTKLKEIHELTARVTKLEKKNSRLYGALTLMGLLWTTAAALLLRLLK